MGSNLSSLQRPAVSPLLTPIDTRNTLKQQWMIRKKRRAFPLHEYLLNEIPESFKTFVELFLKEDGRGYDHNRLIWTSKKSFVRAGDEESQDTHLPLVYPSHRFQLGLESDSHDDVELYIHSSTIEDAMACLGLLVGIHDDHFDDLRLTHRDEDDDGELLHLCPLTSVLLEKILLQNAKRKNTMFLYMIFTPDQTWALATSGTRTDVELNSCKFQDDGAAFLEALATRPDPQTGLAKLTISFCLPFPESILFFSLSMLQCLALHTINLESEEACRAVAEAELKCLELMWCELADGGAALVESVRIGRGPKGLSLDRSDNDFDNNWSPFDSSERFVSFMDALRGNSHLERLKLSGFGVREVGILAALSAALFGNIGLIHLGFDDCGLNESCFCELLRAISVHPSLRTLDLTSINIDMDGTEATHEVANMLSVNTLLEACHIHEEDEDSEDDHDFPFDALVWDKLVTPRLEYNIYRKRFPPIQNIRVPSTRAAVMASALAHVSNNPSPAFMLLCQNSDIISSYPLRVESQITTSSGKSTPSLDGMVVSKVVPP
jgi:hypothetical protein